MITSTTTILEIFHFISLLIFFISLLIIIVSRILSKAGRDVLNSYSLAVSVFPVLLVIVVVRSYIFEPFRIPSESMFPLLTTGDVVYVSKSSYDIKFPLTNFNLFALKNPQRGDVAVFKYPLNMKTYFIKRVIAVPGDKIVWQGDDIFINGQRLEREISIAPRPEIGNPSYIRYSRENLLGFEYIIRRLSSNDSSRFDRTSTFLKIRTEKGLTLQGLGTDTFPEYLEIEIPEGFYFVMGDNRDQSLDSREWGLVSRDNFVGRANYNLFNLNPEAGLFPQFNFRFTGRI